MGKRLACSSGDQGGFRSPGMQDTGALPWAWGAGVSLPHHPSPSPPHLPESISLMMEALSALNFPCLPLSVYQIHAAVPHPLPGYSSSLTEAKLPPISGKTQGKNTANPTLEACSWGLPVLHCPVSPAAGQWEMGSPEPLPSTSQPLPKQQQLLPTKGLQPGRLSCPVPSAEATPKGWDHSGKCGCFIPLCSVPQHSCSGGAPGSVSVGSGGCGLQELFGQFSIPPGVG